MGGRMFQRGLDIEISSDRQGLPSVAFNGDDGFVRSDRRTLRLVQSGRNGAIELEFLAPWRFRGPRRLWLPPLATVAGLFGVALGIEHLLGILPRDVQGTMWEQVGYGSVFAGAALSGIGTVWLYYRNRFGQSLRRPWDALQGFVVSDSTTLYGDGYREDAARPRAHVIRAEFGTACPAFEVISTQKTLAEVAELHRILTAVFVEQKPVIVVRFNGKELSGGGDVPGNL